MFTKKEVSILMKYLEKTLIKSDQKIKEIKFVGYAGQVPIFNVVFNESYFPNLDVETTDEETWLLVQELESDTYYSIKKAIHNMLPNHLVGRDIYINFDIQ